MNKEQLVIYNELKKIIKILNEEIDYCIGFGSFWQNFDKYNSNSDIDFIVILKKEPNLCKLQEFYKNIEDANKKFNCMLSAQIFIGKYKDLFSSYENILRLLTIINKKNNVIEIYNYNNYKFYDDIYKLNLNILKVVRYQIFNLIRFYNRDFYKFESCVDKYRYREIKFLFDAIYSYYKIHPKSKNAKYLITNINKYYKNYEKYNNNKLFHKMLMDLCEIVSKEEENE